MRIAIFSDTYYPQINGVATATYTLANVLKAKGNDVLVVTVGLEGQKKLTFEDGVVSIPGIVANKLYSYTIISIFSSKAYKIVKNFAPEVVHIQTEMGAGIFGRIVASSLKVPLIYTYHTMYEDYTYYVTKGIKPIDGIAKSMVASLSTLIGDSTTEFTTTSYKTKKALRRYGVKKYINVIPNGLNLDMFDVKNLDKTKLEELKKKLGIEDKFTILILGRLAKEKSNDVVLKYVRKYLDKYEDKDISILVVGDGPDKPNLEALAKELKLDDITTFVGKVDHKLVPYYYNISSLYVSASTSETQGLTFNEAMASKVVVMARYDDNLVEAIIDRKTGFFFKDEASFVKTLREVRSLSRDELSKIEDQAYKNDMEKFSLDLYYERMINVYRKAIRKYW